MHIHARKSQTGSVTTEFILVLPAFIFCCMLVLEFSFLWVDRHFLRLATFEAARIFASSTELDPCAEDSASWDVARRAAAIRMAAVTPSASNLLAHFGFKAPADAMNSLKKTPIVGVFKYLVDRLPTAFALTRMTCEFDASVQAATVKLTYYRLPRMPFIKNVMWALYILGKINNEIEARGFSEYLQLTLDDWFGAVRPRIYTPNADALLPTIATEKLRSFLEEFKTMPAALTEDVDLVSGMENIAGKGNPVSQRLKEAESIWNTKIDEIGTVAGIAIDAITGKIENQCKLLTMITYAVPQWLRFVPMEMKVRLVTPAYENRGDAWEKAMAFGVAPFTSDKTAEHWREWALSIGRIPPKF